MKYKFVSEIKVGHGTFAEVFMCKMAATNKVVAVKKIRSDKSYKNRELQIHREMHH